jgi:prepilin-type N-terminal cleavage/methylation domain-containing protein
MLRRAFTLLEMVVVIVIIGILSTFGVDLLIKMYENYVFSNTQNTLQSKSELAVMQVANRLEYRIRDSVIARSDKNSATPIPIGNAGNTSYRVLEWIGIDADGWLETPAPDWSGFIDLAASSATQLATPGTTSIPTTLGTPAIFFIGSDVDLGSNFGWTGAILNQDASMHPVNLDTSSGQPFLTPAVGGTFAGAGQPNDIYEFYQLARSAYAVSLEDFDGDGETDDLVLYYDYQPWNGGSIATASSALLADNVSTFQFRSVSDILKIQICVTTEEDITGEGQYAICKEKTIF